MALSTLLSVAETGPEPTPASISVGLRRWWQGCMGWRCAGRRWRFSALSAVLLVGLAVVVERVQPDVVFAGESHARLSLTMAIDRAFCGSVRLPAGDPTPTMTRLRADPSLRFRPIRQLLPLDGETLASYCSTATRPVVNNENSLMLLERVLLWARPNASVAEIGSALLAVRLLMLALFGSALLFAGAGWIPTFALLAAALETEAAMSVYHYSVYPFLLPLLLAHLAVYLTAAHLQLSTRPRAELPLLAATGLLTGFAVNMRSSHLPIYGALLLLYVAATARARATATWPQGLRRIGRLGIASVLLFGLGYWGFRAAFIAPLVPPTPTTNYTYHVVAHPLVLGLAEPPNALAAREGIKWNDSVGLVLALRADPSATFLGPKYEKALWQYYEGLWKRYPYEMAALYATKFSVAGTQLLGLARQDRIAGLVLAPALLPWALIAKGWLLLLLLAGAGAVGLAAWGRHGSRPGFFLAQAAAIAVLIQVESSVIIPRFVPQYHAGLVFGLAALTLVGGPLLCGRLAAWVDVRPGAESRPSRRPLPPWPPFQWPLSCICSSRRRPRFHRR